ncbi:MAG: diguanylate cyclase domain-containing protein [Roseateles sp.]
MTRHCLIAGVCGPLGRLLVWGLLLAALLVPRLAAAVEPITVRVHFHQPQNDYSGWSLYVWGPGLVLPHTVTWDRSLQPAGVDAYGVYFDVGVEPTVQTFNMIVHRGEVKGAQRDMAVDLVRHGREVWIREGDDTVYAAPPDVATPYALGQEVERQQRLRWAWMVGGGLAGLALLLVGWRIAGRRLDSSREQLAATMQMLVQTQSELRAQGERLQGMASDELTGLPTRGGLQQALEQALARGARQPQSVAVMYVDLDGFKPVNDGGGHDAGDEVLRTVARRLRAAVRDCDFVARVGGDEFVVVVEGVASPMQAFLVGRKLVRAASQAVAFAGRDWCVGASVGIAVSPDDGRDAATLLKAADTAMYEAKRAGKGACRFAEPQRQAALERQLLQEGALRRALDEEALGLSLAPVVELASGRVLAHQAAPRWLFEGQPVAVSRLVDGADDAALAQRLDRWLLLQA